ncbi:MAG: Gfo/Idh/MocA family oxidoreductase, partial [Pseudomonadota bacterium]
DANRAAALASENNCQTPRSIDELLRITDAVIIATPAKTHYQLAKQALLANCHVLVEKPLALSANDAIELVDIAAAKKRVLQVGHQERLVCQTMGLLDIDEVPSRLFAVREAPPPHGERNLDVSVVWDLMIHDLDLAHTLTGSGREVLSAAGIVGQYETLDQCSADVLMNGCRTRFVASRSAEQRRRHLTLEYESGEIFVDFIDRTVRNSTKYSLDSDLSRFLPDPLGAADYAFIEACLGNVRCLVPGREAASAVATAERIEQMATTELGAVHG